jgi:hypothetical protein
MGVRKDSAEGKWPHTTFLLCVVLLMAVVALYSSNKPYGSASGLIEQGKLRLVGDVVELYCGCTAPPLALHIALFSSPIPYPSTIMTGLMATAARLWVLKSCGNIAAVLLSPVTDSQLCTPSLAFFK